jgi:PAS domain S-box-containing protein
LFDKLNLKIEIGQLESIYITPIKDAIIILVLISILLLIIGLISSRILVNKITSPILQLYENVKNDSFERDYISLGTNDELEVLSKAFYEKTNKLYESEELLQTVINTIPDFIFFKDKEFKFLGCNKAFLEFLGIDDVNEIIGKDDFDLFDEKEAKCFRQLDEAILSENDVKFNNEWLTCLDGTKIYTQVLKAPFFYNKNDVGVLGVSRDITELYKLQVEEIKKQKILAQQAKMASMGEMIANIAHQWRQPLSVISTAATGMKIREELDLPIEKSEVLNNYDIINNNAQYLSQTIEDFKNFLKGERIKKVFNLTKEIKSVLILVEGSVKSNDIEVVLDLDDNIDLDSYPNELSQCMINIFNNAKDQFKDNKIENKFFIIKTEKINGKVYIRLRDNAGGIKEDILPKIFDPYFTTKDSSRGTGLGLSMAFKLITEGMDGRIEAKNVSFEHLGNNYNGAEFIIEL